MTLEEEIRGLIQKQPHLMCSELMAQLEDLGWQLERPLCPENLLEQTPAWIALLSFSRSSHRSEHRLKTPTQLIDSGKFCVVEDLIGKEDLESIVSFCDQHFIRPGLSPVPIYSLDNSTRERLIHASLCASSRVLESVLKDNSTLTSQKFVLLMNRCLLRRTYPPNVWREEYKNNNNQNWHQDSNSLFDSRAMVTIWIPLQDGAGTSCPGLEVSSLPARFFSCKHGDNTVDHDHICIEHKVKSATQEKLNIKRGDGAVFNGLTYHRTAITKGMSSHRDALLLRICSIDDAVYFPGHRGNDLQIQ